jgi:peptidyl-prolyl cis-trans isomerase SurA
MKQLQLLIISLILCVNGFSQEKDPTVLTIDGQNITESEFLYIYTKNNPNPSYKKEDLDAYMEMFINYKLKVKQAEVLRYDTIPALKKELKQYRSQLSLPYMVDKEKNEMLIKEAYERTKNEINASHILIRVTPNAIPKDTLAAYNKCIRLRERILGGEDFGTVAAGKGGSEDPSAKDNKGDLGYFTAFQMVFKFEETAYNTKVGEVSMPVRTKFGYHLIMINDIRESRGKMKSAHIMILSNNKMNKEENLAAEKKINEIYDLLEGGENFEDLAAKYSEDQSSKAKGGQLPVFGGGAKQRMVPEFEDAAFNLVSDGDYSKPIKTAYGYHIIKRISVTPIPSYEDMYRELKLKVERDPRALATKDSFLNKLKTEYGYSDANSHKLLEIFYAELTNEIFRGNWKGLPSDAHDSDILFSFKDKYFTVKDFETYLINLQLNSVSVDIKSFVDAHFKSWSKSELMNYEDSQLELKYPEFKSLIQEYRDGILVFEIMQNEIWNKASQDSIGIQEYYNAHSTDFTYPVRYKGVMYKCKDKLVAKEVNSYIATDTMDHTAIQNLVNKDSQLNLVVKKHTFNTETTASFKKGKKIRTFKKGLNKAYKFNDEYYILHVEEVLEPRKREFSEAKGLVTAAYQNQMELDWIESLRKSFKIEIHQEALYNVGN